MRLTEARTRKQVWSDRLEYETTALAEKADAVPLQFTRRMSAALFNAEVQRVRNDPRSRGAMDFVLRGTAERRERPGVEGEREARKQFEAALRLDPNFVPALADSAISYEADFEEGPVADPGSLEEKMDRLSDRAVSIDPSDAYAWNARAWALDHLGRWDEALAAIEHAETLDPAVPAYPFSRSWFMISTGRPAEALVAAQRAAAIDPPGGPLAQLLVCNSYFYLGRYDDAVSACQRSAALNNWWVPQMYLAAAYAHIGDLNKANVARDALLKTQPGFTINRYAQIYYSSTPAFFDLVDKHLATGLRKVGIPEK
jgi:adenylate cyclase